MGISGLLGQPAENGVSENNLPFPVQSRNLVFLSLGLLNVVISEKRLNQGFYKPGNGQGKQNFFKAREFYCIIAICIYLVKEILFSPLPGKRRGILKSFTCSNHAEDLAVVLINQKKQTCCYSANRCYD